MHVQDRRCESSRGWGGFEEIDVAGCGPVFGMRRLPPLTLQTDMPEANEEGMVLGEGRRPSLFRMCLFLKVGAFLRW